MKKINILLLFVFSLFASFAQNNIRLAKEIYKGNDFSQIIDYSYNADGSIQKIILSQDGKLHTTTSDFVFNNEGLLTSYLTTYNLKISPQKTTITYDNKKRVSGYVIKKTENNKLVKSRNFIYEQNTVKIVQPENLMQPIVYTYDADSNIIKKEGLGEPGISFTNLYNKYDNSKNPHLFLGGYVNVDETPMSIHNSLEDTYVNIYVINRKIEYEKIFASNYKAGGAKIPTQLKNGLPLKYVETSFDKAYNKVMPVSTTTFQYIKL